MKSIANKPSEFFHSRLFPQPRVLCMQLSLMTAYMDTFLSCKFSDETRINVVIDRVPANRRVAKETTPALSLSPPANGHNK